MHAKDHEQHFEGGTGCVWLEASEIGKDDDWGMELHALCYVSAGVLHRYPYLPIYYLLLPDIPCTNLVSL